MASPRQPAPSSGLPAVRRRLRACRRVRELALAQDACEKLLLEKAGDRRAVAVQAWLAEARGDSQAVDGHLAELEAHAADRGFLRDRNRLALRRAAFRAGLGAPARALYERALELAIGDQDGFAILQARRALLDIAVRGGEAAELAPALDSFVAAATSAARLAEGLATVSALAAGEGQAALSAARLLANRALVNHEEEVAAGWLREILRRQPGDAAAARALETLYVAAGSWEELADLYAVQATRLEGPERGERLARVAELFEHELGLPSEAARAWGAAVAAGLGLPALREQLRLYREAGDGAAARRALDDAVERAGAGEALADTLLVRARWRRAQGDRAGATEDLERALRASPGAWPALRERAELKAEGGDVAGARALELALERPGVPQAERLASWRCLAVLYRGPLGRAADAKRVQERLQREAPDAADDERAEV